MSTKTMFIMDLGHLLTFLAMGSSVKHVSSCALPKTTEVISKFTCPILLTN